MSTKRRLGRSTPEAQGIASSAIASFVEAADREIRDLHSLMLVRRGQVVAEGWWAPYAATLPHVLFSLSKSFTSTAVGLAVAEGRLTVDDTVVSFFPDETPAQASAHLAAMRVRHLLSMTTGHTVDTTAAVRQSPDGNWVRTFLAQPVEREPGTHFLYNSGATYLLSAIVQRLTGQPLLNYLQPRLFAPLGIEGPTWESCPRGINVGGWGLSITTEDIACFGQLYLQRGRWEGRSLIGEDWVAEATGYQTPNSSDNPDWAQGYGYQFWRCRHGAYRGDGAFGQFCVVLPAQETVLAITAGVANMQSVLDLVWHHLLPALGDQPLPAMPTAETALRQRLAALVLARPGGPASAAMATRMLGRAITWTGQQADLTALRLDFQADSWTLALTLGGVAHQIVGRYDRWQIGQAALSVQSRPPLLGTGAHRSVAAAGAWLDDQIFQAVVWFTETPFKLTLTSRLDDDQAICEAAVNLTFGSSPEVFSLVGQAV